MRCRDCESHLTDGREAVLGESLKRELAAHLEKCPACRALRDDLKRLRASAPGLAAPPLPAALERRVRAFCHDEIGKLERQTEERRKRPALPAFFWPAFGALVALTAATILPGLKDLFLDGEWTSRTTLALVFVVQNVLTLLFAPVILLRRLDSGSLCRE
ncbi:MAG: hypothetical protein JW747_06260 [Candidatus Aminicenantes bacterium]|nr:hypothetical protein [Candidatus Aminicenantes bacterium]